MPLQDTVARQHTTCPEVSGRGDMRPLVVGVGFDGLGRCGVTTILRVTIPQDVIKVTD